jgi:hypothetical protein
MFHLGPAREGLDRRGLRASLAQRREVVPAGVDEGAVVAVRRAGDRRRRLLRGDARAEPPQFAGLHRTGLDERVELLAPVELPHADGVLDELALLVHRQPAARAHDAGQAEVQARGEALVEPQLLLAEVTAARAGREVEEVEANRLLDLVGEAAGQEHPGDVGLDELRPFDRTGPRGRIEQGVRQALHEALPGRPAGACGAIPVSGRGAATLASGRVAAQAVRAAGRGRPPRRSPPTR